MKNIVQSKCLPFIAMFNLLVCISIRLFGIYPILLFSNVTLTLSTILFFPLWCILNDITAEIFGYKTARNLLVSNIICMLIFSLFTFFSVSLISLRSNVIFGHTFDNMTWHVLYSFLVYALAWRVNTFFLLKWKGILNSKYFILRSIGSSSIGIIISVTFLVLYYYHGNYTYNIEKFVIVTLTAILVRILLTSLLTFPACLAIACIRTIDSEYLNSGTPVLENPFLKKENSIAQ